MKILRLYFLLLSLIGIESGLYGQIRTDNYPVQVTPILAGTTSARLSTYFSGNNLRINLLLKDLTKSSIQVYLSWSIEGNGIHIGTREGYVPASYVTLQRGIINTQLGLDLQTEYFRSDVLSAVGVDENSAINLNLPEGFYTFTARAYEAGTGREVSNEGTTFLVIASALPPVINLPFVGAEIPPSEPQNFLIQWSPRHFTLPGSSVSYHLKVCQVPDDDEATQETMSNCITPIVDETVTSTTYQAGGALHPLLHPLDLGKRYAVQVLASDGTSQMVFSNGGNSEVTWFRYGKECLPPTNVALQTIGSGQVQVTWDAAEEAQTYVLEYKQEDATDWISKQVYGTRYMVSGLDENLTYNFRVSTDCGGSSPSASSEEISWQPSAHIDPTTVVSTPADLADPQNIKVQVSGTGVAQSISTLDDFYKIPTAATNTMSASPSSSSTTTSTVTPPLQIPQCVNDNAKAFVGCSSTSGTQGSTGTQELTALSVGDVLGIFDYKVYVTKVNAGSSPFSGEGLAVLPFMNGAKALVEFSGVKAKKAAGDVGNGGCVYAVNGYFRIKPNTSTAEVQAAQQGLIQQLLQVNDPNAFAGTLQQAIAGYDLTAQDIRNKQQAGTTVPTTTTNAFIQYTEGILQGSQQLKNTFEATYGASTDPRVDVLRQELLTLTGKLSTNEAAIKNGVSPIPSITDLTTQYQDIFDKLKALGTPAALATPKISNVVASKLTSTGATLTWKGDPSFDAYVITYTTPNGATLVKNVTAAELSLSGLTANTNYPYKIQAYAGGVLKDTYSGGFQTSTDALPPPTNLQYTILSDNSVKVNWTPDPSHKTFTLTYNGKDGAVHTLPNLTQPNAIITGIDPTQIYSYEVVGNKDNLISVPITGEFATSLICSVSVYKKMNTSTTLVASCSGTVNWYNGGTDVGIISKVGTGRDFLIQWQDGETASALLMSGAEIQVSPDHTKTYTAFCTVTDPNDATITKSCTSSVTVEVPNSECASFDLVASSTSINFGESVTLTATGCTSDVVWSNELGTTTSIKVSPISPLTKFSVSCGSCVKELTINTNSSPECNFSLSLGDNAAETQVFGRELVVLQDFREHIGINITGCQAGSIDWDIPNDQKFSGSIPQDYYNKMMYSGCFSSKEMYPENPGGKDAWCDCVNIKGGFYIGATCTQDGKECKKNIYIPYEGGSQCNTDYNSQFGGSVKLDIDKTNNKLILSSMPDVLGNTLCTGEVIWYEGESEIGRDNPHIVSPIPSGDTHYYVKCHQTSCWQAISYNPNENLYQYPMKLRIAVKDNTNNLLNQADMGNSNGLLSITNKPYPIVLSTLDCSNGHVLWTYANQTISTPTLTINTQPDESTVYTATCVSGDNIITEASVTIESISNTCFKIDAPTSINVGDNATLSASGCFGSITWYEGSTNAEILDVNETTVITPTEIKNHSYIAVCDNPVCSEQISINVNPCQMSITTSTPYGNTNNIYLGDKISLIAEGCNAGTILWIGGEADGQEGNEVSVRPLENTTYTASCDFIDCHKDITINVTAQRPDGLYCENFTISANKKAANWGDKATLTAAGCTGGTITWQDGSHLQSVQVEVSICGVNNYTAKCQKGSKSVDAKTSIDGSVYFVISPTTSEIPINSNKTVTLSASGCVGGTVSWSNGQNGQSITVMQIGTYSATCINIKDCNPVSKSAIISNSCPDFKLSASQTTAPANTNTNVTLTASGCNGGQIIWWDNQSPSSLNRTISVRPPQTYTATCSFCPQSQKSIIIAISVPPSPSVCPAYKAQANPTFYIDGDTQNPVTLSTSGYDCVGNGGVETWSSGTNVVTPSSPTEYTVTCTHAGIQDVCTARVSVDVMNCNSFSAHANPTYTDRTTIAVNGCYGNLTWKNTPIINGNEIDASSSSGIVQCDKPNCREKVDIIKIDCPTLEFKQPYCDSYGREHYPITLHNTLDYGYEYRIVSPSNVDVAWPVLSDGSLDFNNDFPKSLKIRTYDTNLRQEVCLNSPEVDVPDRINCSDNGRIGAVNSSAKNSKVPSISSNLTTADSSPFCTNTVPMKEAGAGYLAQLCSNMANINDDNGNSLLKNTDGTMTAANAQLLMQAMTNALQTSTNTNLSNFTLPSDQTAILAALQSGNCQTFGEAMAAGFPDDNTTTYGDFNNNLRDQPFNDFEKNTLQPILELPEAIKAILARIREGNKTGQTSFNIGDIITKYETAFGLIKNTAGAMDYKGSLVLSDGITTITDIHLLFSNNIVQFDPLLQNPTIDISLQNQSASNNTFTYGLGSGTSQNWLTITDNNEFDALKKYLNAVSRTILTAEQLKLLFPNIGTNNLNKYLPYINKYFDKYNINSCQRIKQFLAQVEGEVGEFHYNVENVDVSSVSAISKYCTNIKASTSSQPLRRYVASHPSEFVNDFKKFENYIYAGFNGNCTNPNTSSSCNDGYNYRGRGCQQLTGLKNYTDFNTALNTYLPDRTTALNKNINVITNPELVGSDPELYILSAIWYWDSKGGNSIADQSNCTSCMCVKKDKLGNTYPIHCPSPLPGFDTCPDPDCVGNVTKFINGGCIGICDRMGAYKRMKPINCN